MFDGDGLEEFVDLDGTFQSTAEIVRREKKLARLAGAVAANQKQSANDSFVSRVLDLIIDPPRSSTESEPPWPCRNNSDPPLSRDWPPCKAKNSVIRRRRIFKPCRLQAWAAFLSRL